MWERIKHIFGGLNITWPKTIIFAIVMGIYTALMALLVPDGNSFHDIAVTLEWWVLPAMFILINCKKPLDAAFKVLVFFLISQPLIYLLQVPFSSMGWKLFEYYPYWFGFTILTFPAAFICWYIKKDQWYSGIILACATVLLGLTAVAYLPQTIEHLPNHLISIIYCFASIIFFIFALLKDKFARIICTAITIVAIAIYAFLAIGDTPYETYRNTIFEDNNIVIVGEPYISTWSSESGAGNVEIIKNDSGYTFKITGTGNSKYNFTVSDDENEYDFEYYFDKDQNTVIVNRI